MLTLTFLGTGNAFARRNFHSNALIEAWEQGPDQQKTPDETMLIDFGSSAPLAIHQLKDKPGFEYLNGGVHVDFTAIKRIFVTHQHADHIGGLLELGLLNRALQAKAGVERPFKPQLVSPASVMRDLWDGSLKGGMGVMPGRYALMQDYFFVQALEPGDPDTERFSLLKRYEFQPVRTDHIKIERKYDWPSYGLRIVDRKTGEVVFYSGDTKFDYPAYAEIIHEARLIFHDAQLTDVPNPVHALLSELRTMPAEEKKKTVLYHYEDTWDSEEYASVAEEFQGFANPQERYVLFD